MQTHATAKGLRLSPLKMQLVAKQVRGLSVEQALLVLKFGKTKAASLMYKVLSSAVANAENNQGADIDDLVISRVLVNEGPRLKRIQPRARGRADRIIKRSCHVTVAVAERGE